MTNLEQMFTREWDSHLRHCSWENINEQTLRLTHQKQSLAEITLNESCMKEPINIEFFIPHEYRDESMAPPVLKCNDVGKAVELVHQVFNLTGSFNKIVATYEKKKSIELISKATEYVKKVANKNLIRLENEKRYALSLLPNLFGGRKTAVSIPTIPQIRAYRLLITIYKRLAKQYPGYPLNVDFYQQELKVEKERVTNLLEGKWEPRFVLQNVSPSTGKFSSMLFINVGSGFWYDHVPRKSRLDDFAKQKAAEEQAQELPDANENSTIYVRLGTEFRNTVPSERSSTSRWSNIQATSPESGTGTFTMSDVV